MGADEVGINRLSEHIIGCAFPVFNTLGLGFPEKVYENALAHELRKAGPTVAQRQGIGITYDGVSVGDSNFDLLVEDAVVIELKAINALNKRAHRTMPQLSEGDRSPPLPIVELRQGASGNPAHGSRSLGPLGISAFIHLHLRLIILACLMGVMSRQAAEPRRDAQPQKFPEISL
jgi:GxxExxY protein